MISMLAPARSGMLGPGLTSTPPMPSSASGAPSSGSSLRRDKAFMMLKPAKQIGTSAASLLPVMMTSASPRASTLMASPSAVPPVAHAAVTAILLPFAP